MMKAKRRSDIHPIVLFFCDQVRYYVDMASSRFEILHDQGHRQSQWPRLYMKQINHFVHTAFVSCKWDHAF